MKSSIITESLRRPLVMGILNITPDSFSDGGDYFSSVDIAVERALQLEAGGADIVDIGGESTRPGSESVSPQQQIDRILPVITALSDILSIPMSVDTTNSQVFKAAYNAGAGIINDISAFEDDPELVKFIAVHGCPCIIMHKKGRPANMQTDPQYFDVVTEVYEYLESRIKFAVAGGVKMSNIVVDPGIGFGKTQEHNLQLIAGLKRFQALGVPVLLGASRKSFIGKILDIANPSERIYGDLAVLAYAVSLGVNVVRVHEVKPAVQVIKMIKAITAQDYSNIK